MAPNWLPGFEVMGARREDPEHLGFSLGHIYIKTCKVFRADWILPLDLSLQC